VVPFVLMTAGMLGVVPLTGVVTPFISFGGSAMVANFAAIGMLAAIGRTASSAPGAAVPFRRGITSMAATLTVTVLALVGVLANVQVVHADAYAARPHVGLQADGVRRYQYNPRLLDLMGQIPRGTIFDRNGLPLATSDRELMRTAPAQYKQRGVDATACGEDVERCYPIGAAGFHVIGELPTRRNWGAPNSSYAERDLQDRLRGFSTHADLVRVLRHRHQPEHRAMRTFLERTRDVTLTIDGPLQARVARILARHAARTSSGRAAAVVIDPATGDLLASVSYPLPTNHDTGTGGPSERGRGRPSGRPMDEDLDGDAIFDRARYGLYAPGSTFKLVTAVAALRLDAANWNSSYMCARQNDGRVGAAVPGFGVVRDDLLDTHPHGSITMRDAIVQSCNAYFSQLAVRLGPQPLLDTATLFGVSVARDNSAARLGMTLAHAAYGQGDVVATPLRMARVAAAIADGGLLREPRITASADGRGRSRAGEARAVEADRQVGLSAPQRLLSADAAKLLANSLRDAVVVGTGRNVSANPSRIAGKTGTAEVTHGSSHAWFVGFAPQGAARKQIAFAVLFENAGYGGAIAAPAAGEIVTAAAARGLVE